MSGTLSGGLGCLCRVFECGCGSRLRPAAQKGCAGKGFRHHIQNVGFQPDHWVLTIDKTRDGDLFARIVRGVNNECHFKAVIGRILLLECNESLADRSFKQTICPVQPVP